MIRDWLKSRQQLRAELEEVREECADVARRLDVAAKDCDHCAEAARLLADAIDDRENIIRQLQQEKAKHAAAAFTLGALQLEIEGKADVCADPPARTPSGELLQERARADALEQRVHLLQEANMRADCMHKPPVQGAVSAPAATFRF